MRDPGKFLAVVAAALLAIATPAAVPSVISYQGRLTDNSPQQVPIDATVSMDFSIWDAASGGASLWSETQSVAVAGGLFDVLLGSSTPIPATVFTSGSSRYLEIHVSGETLAPRQQIAATPFASAAAHADDAATLGGLAATAFQQRIAAPCPAGYAINAVASDGTATCIQGAQGPQGPPGPPGPPGPAQGAISGSVIHCSGPQARALVYVLGQSAVAYTATDGSYQLTGLPNGTYEVDISYPATSGNYVPLSNVTVSNGQTTALGAYNLSDTSTDTANCGSCGHACSTNHIPAPTCTNGVCGGACTTGYGDCNGAFADGCEQDLYNDPNNCGFCGTSCSANHVTRACALGSCQSGTCNAGWGDCNGDKTLDGCEVNLNTSAANCGSCGQSCSTNHIPAPTCTNGVCGGACATGYADCNGAFADGCEVNLNTSAANCGSCGHACGGGTPNCSGGACVP